MSNKEVIERMRIRREEVLGWYTPQNVSIEHRLSKDACDYYGPAFLYICNEIKHNYDGIGWTKIVLDDYSKIGVTNSSEGPWSRLRVLQQGNPRDLQFTHLYVGQFQHIMNLEKIIKELYCFTEWSNWPPDFLKSEVDDIIERLQYSVWPISIYGKTEYTARKKSSCWMKGDFRKVLQMQIDRLRKEILVEEDANG